MEKRYNLTFWQLVFLRLQLNTDKVVSPQEGYYIWGNFKINEKVDFKKLNKAINFFIEKNDSIRTKLYYEDGVIKQYFERYKSMDFPIIDVQDEKEVQEIQNQMNEKLFDMIENYLFDIKMYRLPNGYGGVLLKVHHVIADGWSLGIAAYEVINYYTGKFVPPFIGSFGDYLDERDNYLSSSRVKKDQEYWEYLFKDGIPEAVTFPPCKVCTENYSFDSEKYIYELDEKIIELIRKYCNKNKISLSKFFMSCYAVLINKICNSNKFVMNNINANRKNIKERLTTGVFLIYTYFLVECSNIKFNDFIKNIENSMFLAYKHRDYIDRCFNELVNKVDPSKKNLPLAYLTFSYQNLNFKTDKKDLDYEVIGDNSSTSGGLDMIIHILDIESNNRINLIYDYLINKYDENYIIELNNKLLEIINQVLNNDDIYIDDIKVKEFKTILNCN